MSEERFSVVQFFPDDSYEYVRERVTAQEAMKAVEHYINCVGARLGTTRRVIVTDSGDCTCFEWIYGQGITFPPTEPNDTLGE